MGKNGETLRGELTRSLMKRLNELWNWLKPDKDETVILQLVKLVLKIPVFILVLALSPVVLAVLLIIFIGTF